MHRTALTRLGALLATLVLALFAACSDGADDITIDIMPSDTLETITGDSWFDGVLDVVDDMPVDACVPDCAGKDCGDDGCGDVCGKCTQGFLCSDEQVCVLDCEAACDALECGDGGTDGECDCGTCDVGYGCTADGVCSAECGELCAGMECGEAGEDGECDCGQCDEYYLCVDGECEVDCDLACAAVECTPEWAVDLCDCGGCDDANPCTDDVCTVEGVCEFAGLDAVECDDGDPCTVDGMCQAGVCVAVPVICDDDNICTDDTCDPDTGDCVFTPNNVDCDDGDVCTVADECNDGVCDGVPVDCECDTDVDCEKLEDGDLCNGTLFCNTTILPHLCEVDLDSLVECPDPDADDPNAPCLQPSCDPETGECGFEEDNEGFPCADPDLCTVADFCEKGKCVGGVDANCNDGNLCTDDSCDPELGCMHTPNQDPCEDGDPCTVSDQCEDGECVHGPALDCDDGNVCTDDLCDPLVLGGCVYVNNQVECDDLNACMLNDACSGGVCVGGMALDCNDENPCTDDACDPLSGCINTPNTSVCDDGDPCTTTDFCVGGVCIGEGGLDCDDDNPCTVDLCENGAGCVYMPGFGVCDDGNACSLGDMCVAGICKGSETDSCDDGNPCTTDSCEPLGGCQNTPNDLPCSDENACTILDMCEGGACVGTVDVVCLDQNPCTADLCDPASGCQFPDVDGMCDDGNPCTTGDACVDGVCAATAAKNCDDGNPCTTDHCLPAQGCVSEANTLPCNDGDPCTFPDVCGDGACAGATVVCGDGEPCTGDGCEVPACDSGDPAACDDDNPCTDDECGGEDGLCENTPNDAECSDGNDCTTGDHCEEGACVSGGLQDCDNGNPCTDEWCEPQDGCQSTPNTVPCSDGDACTMGDACGDGECVPGASLDCDDGKPCTDDTCDPQLGCQNVPNAAECDDGNACTTGDACQSGACAAGGVLDCNDGNHCTLDACDPTSGCLNTATDGPCTDGDACTVGDACDDGVCVPGPGLICDDDNPCTDDMCIDGKCAFFPNAADCDDGNVCTLGDFCGSGECLYEEQLICHDDNPCTTDACDSTDGCVHMPNDAPCDDGDACTNSDVCGEGACVGLEEVNCDDGNPCTDDACEPASGCQNVPNTATCDDHSECTTDDICVDGVCLGVGSMECDDDNPCTNDICLPEGGCEYEPLTEIPCSDGDVCTQDDICSEGQCVPGPLQDCDDGNACTDDICDPAGGCQSIQNQDPCDDGNACTVEDVCFDGECFPGDPADCNDENACTTDACDPVEGCVYENVSNPCSDGDACTTGDICIAGECMPNGTLNCDDGTPCTDDSCEPTSGCENVPNTDPCTDGSVCTVGDLCQNGVCVAGPALGCDDQNICTDDSCDPQDGCQNTPNFASCTDDDACTYGDACVEGQCLTAGTLDCDDGNPCTDDSCSPTEGCVNVPNQGDCDDGNACTGGDHCSDGACVYEGLVECDDDNICTTDSCDPQTGCLYQPNTEPCDDGDACTPVDKCVDGQCSGTGQLVCDDGNVCTDDSCEPMSGCQNVPNQIVCDDNNECTTGDVCLDGVCAGQGSMECDDGNVCTKDICLPDGGCDNVPIDGPCSDNDPCTLGDYCMDSLCQAGQPLICDDENVCTDDSCEEGQCVFAANQAQCDDDNECTLGDHCADKQCVPASSLNCDDENVCTTDSCEPLGGCQNVPNTALCDDDNACTSGDHCEGGLCVPTGYITCDDGNGCTDDSCDEEGGCQYIPNDDFCTDDDACTYGDACIGGECVPGQTVNCDDELPCTVDSCHPALGCQHVPVDAICNDTDECTIDFCDPNTGCKNINQPVDCVLGSWTPWSACSEECGGGTRMRTREIIVPMECDGEPCGPVEEIEDCNIDPCPIDCEWHWGEWSGCADGCPEGSQSRSIVIDVEPMYGGEACPDGDEATQTQTCSMVDTDCDDGDACTLDDICTPDGCVGVDAISVPMVGGGCDDDDDCTLDTCEDDEGQMVCVNTNQPVDCTVGGWTEWSTCASPDGACSGIRGRTRPILVQPECGGVQCPPLEETEDCLVAAGTGCDDGIPCTAFEECDGNGACDGIPVDGACADEDECTLDLCEPDSTQADENGCTHTNVPVDCEVSGWGGWGTCTNDDDTCAGTQTRTRTITVEPACGGAACPNLEETGACNMPQGTDCDDDDECTVYDECDGVGGCNGTEATTVPIAEGGCDDGDDCTTDLCEEAQSIGGTTPYPNGSSFFIESFGGMCFSPEPIYAGRIVLTEETTITALATHILYMEAWLPDPMLSLNLYSFDGQALVDIVACATFPVFEDFQGDAVAPLDTPVTLPAGTYWLTAIAPALYEIGVNYGVPGAAMGYLMGTEIDCECAPPDSFFDIYVELDIEMNFWVDTLDGCGHINNPVDCEVSVWSDWSDCENSDDSCDGIRSRTRTVLVNPECGGAACPDLEETELCFLPLGAACEDGDDCTLGDECDEIGFCVPGVPAETIPVAEGGCDDGDDCTQDGCIDPFACTHDDICLGAPVINEIDYDQPGSDTMEFVEILNPTMSGVDLSEYKVQSVNGANGQVILSVDLDEGLDSNLLESGQMLVVGMDDLIAILPPSTLTISVGSSTFLQNGGTDGVRIVTKAGGAFVDGLAYGGVMPGTGEGDYAAREPSGYDASLARCPDGDDTDDNWADFDLLSNTTPGELNDCDNTLPIDCVVSDWSAWSTCSEPCGGGTQTRTRTIIFKPKNGGAACPNLEETQECNTQPCEGACCTETGCEITIEYDCYMMGGEWQGDGTTCTPDPCVVTEGACCSEYGCQITYDEYECVMEFGGEWMGEGSFCAPDTCQGACCTETEWCVITYDEMECIYEFFGEWMGAGTVCNPDPCQGGACAHSECVTGIALVYGCSPCATAVCDLDSFCCEVSWDSQCVEAAQSLPICGC